MKKCNYCWSLNPDDARVCCGCGANDFSFWKAEIDMELPKPEPIVTPPRNTDDLSKKTTAMLIVFALALLLITGMLAGRQTMADHTENQEYSVQSTGNGFF